mmetsp:Transcript_12943/g.39122  ORF Transcript_12943/g.39122 Transcript_12943/m.39122 type:complete len:238 (+) Transcript_12943:172-885(+)
MARNEEKAQSMLNRWLQYKEEEQHGGPKQTRRPYLASECTDLKECERWRGQILREIAKEVAIIQNDQLGEFRLRELNDGINKLLREKRHWEKQIRDLGGKNYTSISNKLMEDEGVESANRRGYKYFGAAKNLPGVKDLLKPKKDDKKKRTRHELYQGIDADYYGFRDEDDGVLLPLESAAEEKLLAELTEAKRQRGLESSDEEDDVEEDVPLPSKADIERMLVEKRKEEIRRKYLDG